jgi:chaperonin cofactor prefoldin
MALKRDAETLQDLFFKVKELELEVEFLKKKVEMLEKTPQNQEEDMERFQKMMSVVMPLINK